MIGCTPADAKYVGIAWVEVEYGFVWFGMDIDTAWSQYETHYTYSGRAENGWENRIGDGTHPMDFFAGTYDHNSIRNAVAGSNRFVFGVHLKNSTISNYAMNKGKNNSWETEGGGWHFGGRLGVYGNHLFIANNCVSKPTAWFRFPLEVTDTSGSSDAPAGFHTQIYEYANCLGVDVNKNLMAFMRNRSIVTDSNGFYCKDILIKDNWIYSHGNKTFEVAGKWVTMKNNIAFKEEINLKDVFGGPDLQYVVHKSSYKGYNAPNPEDFMNRGYDYGGWNMWFDNNRFEGTGSIGNDGEGMLCQRHGGVEVFSLAMTGNEQGPTGHNGYLAPYDVTVVGLFHAWNKQRGSVGVAKPESNYIADVSTIENTHSTTNAASSVSGVNGNNVQDFHEHLYVYASYRCSYHYTNCSSG